MSIRNLLFWFAFPFVLPQALYVRKTAPRFSSAGGAPAGEVGKGENLRLLAIGDSIIAGVGASVYSQALVGQTAAALAHASGRRVCWQALGVSGYDSSRVLRRLVPKLPQEPVDYVIVSVGVNDVTGLTSIANWRDNLAHLIVALQTHSPAATIAVAGLPPLHGFPLLPQPLRAVFGLRARIFDDVARELIDRHDGVLYIPLDFDPDPDKFAADGYHPSETSYAEYGQQLAAQLSTARA